MCSRLLHISLVKKTKLEADQMLVNLADKNVIVVFLADPMSLRNLLTKSSSHSTVVFCTLTLDSG